MKNATNTTHVSTEAGYNSSTYPNTSLMTSLSNLTGNTSQRADSLITTSVSSGPIIDAFNDKYFSTVLLPSFVYACLLLTIGIPGNGLVVYVYGFKSRQTVSRLFILTLAILDLINCLFSISTELFLLWNFLKFDFPNICKISRFITSFCNHSTTIVLLTIAIDRFKKIHSPLHAKMKMSTAKRVMIFSMIFGILTGIPFALFYGTKTLVLTSVVMDTHTVLYEGKTCLPRDGLSIIFKEILLIVLSIAHVVSDVILIVLYSFVGKAVLSSNKSFRRVDPTSIRSQSNRKTSYELGRRNTSRSDSTSSSPANASKTNTMLFLVTLVFILSFVPYLILAYIRTFQIEAQNTSSFEKAIQQLLLRSYFLNSAVNPIVYCFVSKHFRQEAIIGIRRMFSRKQGIYRPSKPTVT